MKTKGIMLQGTGSSVGKSLMVTALCRIFSRRGIRVAPFKSQNMSLNSYITDQGHEMGRAQVVQAEAAGLVPSSLMNPVLLKPCGDRTSQVIVNGTLRTTLDARAYYTFRNTLKPDVLQAYTTLAEQHDLILVEGAGSPAEINLREHDIANMGMAELADLPVVLVGDIDRGGVFASLYGTVKLVKPDEQLRIQGFIINKFRGDKTILEPGLRELECMLERPVLGVVPYLDIHIDEEDSLTERLSPVRRQGPSAEANVFSGDSHANKGRAFVDIAVIRLPRMSNFTDFAVFDTLPEVRLRYAHSTAALGRPDLIILPGTKNTIADMDFLCQSGLKECVLHLHASGVPLIGICGGFQMLGRVIRDPGGVEGSPGSIPGLGLLDMETVFAPQKHTTRNTLKVSDEAGATALLRGAGNMLLSGYEIHMGQTTIKSAAAQVAFAVKDDGAPEGVVSSGGMLLGTYLHGLFDTLSFTRTVLNNIRKTKNLPPLPEKEGPRTYAALRMAEYDRLADAVESALDMNAFEAIIQNWRGAGR